MSNRSSTEPSILKLHYKNVKTSEKGKKKEATCAVCSIVIKAVGTTTSNFRRHIESKHPTE